jgi:hypothetical protein
MKIFVFKSSLVITIMFLLMSYLGGGPLGVQAAPKPSKTPRQTKTVRPTATFTSTASPTDAPTGTPTYTPTPTDTPTDTLTATQTPTDTPASTPTDTPTHTATPVVPNLLAYWKFDEGTGSSVTDDSGNGHTLTLFNGGGYWTGLSAPVAFTNPFALTTDVNQQYGADSGTINLANQSFSVAMWVKRSRSADARTGAEEFFFSQGSNGSTSQTLHLGFRDSDVFTCAFWGNDLDTSTKTGDVSWHHYACTYDAATQTRKAYKDGVLIGSDTASPFTGSGAVNIGRLAPLLNSYFKGSMDEARIYDGTLSWDQVTELANLTASPCRISATVSPSSGLKLPQTLTLFASEVSHCEVPLQYTWSCTSGTSTACDSFIPSANVAPYGIPNPSIRLNELDSFDIEVSICERGTSNCSTVIRQYTAIEVTTQ